MEERFKSAYITGLAKNNKIQELLRYSYIEIPAVKIDKLLQKQTNYGYIPGTENRKICGSYS